MANWRSRPQKTREILEDLQGYLAVLRERHNLTHKEAKFKPKVGDVVIIETDNKNRGTWPLAIVSAIYTGKDGIIHVVELKTTWYNRTTRSALIPTRDCL